MAVLNVGSLDIRVEVEDRMELLTALADAEERRKFNVKRAAFHQAEAVTCEVARDEVGARIRRGAVRERESLDGVLEPELTDVAVERDEEGVIVAIHTNEDADVYRGGSE